MKKSRQIIYYTDNYPSEYFLSQIRAQIKKACGNIPVISVSQYPISFGENLVIGPIGRSTRSICRQILMGLEYATADIINFCEHDVIYHPSHFSFVPPKNDLFYYNRNVWKLRSRDGQAVYYDTSATSLLVANRKLLLNHYQERVDRLENGTFPKKAGHEPGHHLAPQGIGQNGYELFCSEHPCVCIRHNRNYTRKNRFDRSQFSSKNSTKGWKLSDEIPFWGRTKGRFKEFMSELSV